jgi:threonine aldolase
MRQVGVLAAAGLYALDHNLDRLAEDHEHAQLLAKRLGVDPATVETNMVVLDDVPAPMLAEGAKAQGVLVSQVSATRVRLVTHLDVDRAAVERAADVLSDLLGR